MITAPAVDLELFLSPYIHNEKADLEIEILNIIQPVIGKHNENIKWLDSLIQHQQGDNPDAKNKTNLLLKQSNGNQRPNVPFHTLRSLSPPMLPI